MASKWLTWSPAGKPRKPSEPAPFDFDGHAVEFDVNGERHFLVAAEADAQGLIELDGVRRGEIWTTAELDVIAAIGDPAARHEIARWKRTLGGTLRADDRPGGATAAGSGRARTGIFRLAGRTEPSKPTKPARGRLAGRF
jgi:hypothetical protein